MQTLKYLSGYSPDIQRQVQQLLEGGKLADVLLRRHPTVHEIRSDKALYDYTQGIKISFTPILSPVESDL